MEDEREASPVIDLELEDGEADPSPSVRLYENDLAKDEQLARLRERASRFGAALDAEAEADEGSDAQCPPYTLVESGADLRSGALFLTAPAVGQLDTNGVLRWANARAEALKGVEWIDDSSLVLVFDANDGASAALRALLAGDDVDGQVEDISSSLAALADMYAEASSDDLTVVSRLRRAIAIPISAFSAAAVEPDAHERTPWLRLARRSDVKKRAAAVRSRFYAENGRPVGQPNAKRRRDDTVVSAKRQRELEDLDAELDAFASGAGADDEDADAQRPSPAKRLRERDRADDDVRRRQELDAELDAYVDRAPDEAALREAETNGSDTAGRELPISRSPTPHKGDLLSRLGPARSAAEQQEAAAAMIEADATVPSLMSAWDDYGELSRAERGDFGSDDENASP